MTVYNSAKGGAQVLVVEDDPIQRRLLKNAIERHGHVAHLAENGRLGLEVLKRNSDQINVIVLDLMMPEVSGFNVVAALHDSPDTAGIPILIVTSKTITPEDRDELNGFVSTIMEKADFDGVRFAGEIRRAMSGRPAGV